MAEYKYELTYNTATILLLPLIRIAKMINL